MKGPDLLNIPAMPYMTSTYIGIVCWAVGILLAASAIQLVLVKIKPESVGLAKVTVIIRSWWAIFSVLLTAAAFGPLGFRTLFTIIILFIINEYMNHTILVDFKRRLNILLSAAVLVQMVLLAMNNLLLFSAFPLLYFLVTFPPLLYDPRALKNLPGLTSGYLCFLLLGHCLFHFPALIQLSLQKSLSYDVALTFFFLTLGLTQGNDVFQFLFGKLFGRRKVVPHLSPNKTGAGFLGGLATTSLLASVLFAHLLDIPWPLGLGLGFAIATMGIFGDLTLSTLKRHYKIKDFGNSIPGHGGFTDRVDSLIFTGPVLYYIFHIYLGVYA